ncbi:MAG TPA: ComEC/Rec2 family competence protein, partial [Chloroflexia bacterium]|nr:ComEC/Rec2 family competence protein [Chloroflexia bacterium]
AFSLGLLRSVLAVAPVVPPVGSLRALNVPAAEARSHGLPQVHVRGSVLTDPEMTRQGRASQVRVAVSAVQEGEVWRPIQGGLLALASPWTGVAQGDLVECVGVVQAPPVLQDFNYRAWLARHGIESTMDPAEVHLVTPADVEPRTVLARWRRDAGIRTAQMLPEPEAGLLRGILLGQQKAIDPELWADFNATQTSWLIVVSGSQIMLLLLFSYWLLRRLLPPWPSVLLAGLIVLGYSVFVGLGLPVIRAALTGGLVLLAQGWGRPVTAINLLAIAAIGLTAWDPATIADAGFQLSFVAVAGILLFGAWLAQGARRVPVLGEAVAVGLAAQLTTWPIVVAQFGTLSLTGFPIGVIVGLLISPIMLLGTIQQFAAWLWAPLGQILAWVCWLPLTVLGRAVHWAAMAPLGEVALPDYGWAPVVLWYAILGLWYWRWGNGDDL